MSNDDIHGLLLGWEAGDSQGQPFGFSPGTQSATERRPITYEGDGPLLTCAPTGKGKSRGVLIPNLALYQGPVICVDIRGELYQVTARRRRAMGQQVAVLDPFHVVTEAGDRLNPLDILSLPRASVDVDAEMLAALLCAGHAFDREPYWTDTAMGIVAGLIAHIAVTCPPEERHLGKLREWLHLDQMDYEIAKALDQGEMKNQMARDEFVAYLTTPEDRTRPAIHSTACTFVKALGSAGVAESLRSSTISLRDVIDGKPLSIYIVFAVDKLESHKALLRLWVGTLLTAISRRPRIPQQRTLCLIDECAQLNTLPALRQAITLHRGSGLQVWTAWQDLSQIRHLYPNDWQTIVNNSGVLQAFGINNHLMAKEWGEVLGMEPGELRRLAPDQAIISVHGDCRVCRRPDYLRDKAFAGLFDPNPRFALHPLPERKGPAPHGILRS
jgi:type IV secretion system protein VirD4